MVQNIVLEDVIEMTNKKWECNLSQEILEINKQTIPKKKTKKETQQNRNMTSTRSVAT